ncbi:oxidoreductase [Gemmatimonadetes bacterium T265]|nr:oxidoreductase [Gemmatimonadetes bacterium T265]
MSDLRVGVVGYGLGGSVFHAPLVAATPGLRLAAVVTTDAERGARAAAAYPGVRVVDRAEALWDGARLEPVDVVVVTTPNATHVPIARAAVAAGRHVVVDKPVAPTAAAARALAAAARERGVLLVPFHNRRWDGDFRTARRLVAGGALGTVHRFVSRFDRWRPTPRAGWKEAAGAGAGTGLLYDLGPHLVDQALVLFGPVAAVYAELDRRRPGEAAVDDDFFVALTHASGVRSHLGASALAGQAGARFRVSGTGGAYVKYGLDPQEAALAGGARPGDPGWGEEPEARWGTLGAGDDVHPVPTEGGAYERFYAGVRDAIRGGGGAPVEMADAVAGLEVIEAAGKAAREGRVVRMDGLESAASRVQRGGESDG